MSEGRYGSDCWKGRGVIPAFGSIDEIAETNYDAAAKLRHALTHNSGDLSENRIRSKPTPEEKAIIRAWPGVAVDEAGGRFVVTLPSGFIEVVRQMFRALDQECAQTA